MISHEILEHGVTIPICPMDYSGFAEVKNEVRMDQCIRCNHCDSYVNTEYCLCDKEQGREESLHEPVHERHRTDRTVRLHRAYVAPSFCLEIRICKRA